MKLEDKVCDFELAKKLDLYSGLIRIHTERWYVERKTTKSQTEIFIWDSVQISDYAGYGIKKLCPAPDAIELLEILPEFVMKDNQKYTLKVHKDGSLYYCDYENRPDVWNYQTIYMGKAKNIKLANAIAKMLICLVEMKIVKVEDLK